MSKRNFLTLIILMGVTIVATLSTLIVFIATTNTYSTQLENIYSRSFYELSNNINDLEVDISKLIATNTPSVQADICDDIYSLCQIANTNISNVPVSSDSISNITYFVNRLGGFVYSLSTKIDNNEAWSESDLESIDQLHEYSLNLLYEFNNYVSNFTFNYSILNQVNYNDSDGSSLNTTFDNIQGSNSKIPTLIYDGPFSDAVLNPEINGLPTTEITADEAKTIVANAMTMYTVKDITYSSTTTAMFVTYNFVVDCEDVTLFVQVCARGGFILEITSVGKGGNEQLTLGQCDVMAVNYSKALGIDDVYSVWHTVNGEIAYVNLAPIVNGVIYYPDLIKVKVDRKLGLVTGWEAKNYAYNHTIRTFASPLLTFAEAQAKLSSLLTVTERNYAIIPDDYGTELQTFEFVCTWSNYTYYVYLDTQTGEEVNILRIIKTNSGDLME